MPRSHPPPKGPVFDPFRDRAARDIRNTLAEAFVIAWERAGVDYQSRADALRRRHAQPVYRRYIDRRLATYRAVLEDRRKLGDSDLLAGMILMWNRRLFFEVHELLEGHWQEARGEWREALQTLIQAAAVYVHREAGRAVAAEKLARRVRGRLAAARAHLAPIRNLDALAEALTTPAASPPRLEGKR